MREFFCGWKRKIGISTLGLACGIAMAWVRSIAIADHFDLQRDFPDGSDVGSNRERSGKIINGRLGN
jgi:hypothetical protein